MKTIPACAPVLGLCLSLAIAGCDTETAQLIEEIDAAREGCSEEQLKTSDEACVQMFDRYAEMGEDAIETYIGGMRALDEALRRRGGIRFDTVGLGGAISDSLLLGAEDGGLEPEPLDLDSFDQMGVIGPESLEGPGGGWESTADRDTRLRPRPESYDAAAGGGDRSIDRYRRPPPSRAAEAPMSRRRGTLLPPEERLRRPWIGDEPASDPYFGNGERRPLPQPEEPEPTDDRFHGPPEEPIPPYPRE